MKTTILAYLFSIIVALLSFNSKANNMSTHAIYSLYKYGNTTTGNLTIRDFLSIDVPLCTSEILVKQIPIERLGELQEITKDEFLKNSDKYLYETQTVYQKMNAQVAFIRNYNLAPWDKCD